MRVEWSEEKSEFAELFDFDKYTYEVLFTKVEKNWITKFLSRKSYYTLYYIRRVRKHKFKYQEKDCLYKADPDFLVQGSKSKRYTFTPKVNVCSLFRVVYWDNFQEPSELITRSKMSASGDNPYVVFSSNDLQD